MNEELKDKFFSRKGQIVGLTYARPLKTLKTAKDKNITKVASLSARVGIEYDNMKSVQEKRESGELPAENQGLPYGEWEVVNYTILHNGARQYRFSTLNIPNNVPKVEYFLDGVKVERSVIEPLCQKSEFDERVRDCFNVKEENILDIR